MRELIDLVSVVYRADLAVLRVQAESIWRHLKELDLEQILIMVNDDDDVACVIRKDWWGPMADRVTIIPKSQMGVWYSKDGWLSQQLLKIQAAAMSRSRWCMIVDAKTIFIRPINRLTAFDHQLRARCSWSQVGVAKVFRPAMKIAQDLFNLEVDTMLQPGGVPFLFHNASVRNMITWIEHHTGEKFEIWFQSKGMLTEFVLYSMWIYKQELDIYTSDQSDWLTVCHVCHTQVDQFDEILDAWATRSITASVHRRAWQNLTETKRQRFRDLLVSRAVLSAADL